MRRVKTEATLIGNGATTMLAAHRLASLGVDFIVINPEPNFGIGDLRPYHGLGLWNAAYRSSGDSASLPDLYDRLVSRMREVYPAPLKQSGLVRGEQWSILSSTPIHRKMTEELEKDFFKLERKPWTSGQFRLVNPEHVFAMTRKIGIDPQEVAQIEGAVVRNYSLWWNAPEMGFHLSQLVHNKFAQRCYNGARIEGRYGRKIVLETREGEEVSIESDRGLFIILTGELLPYVKAIVASCEEPWIQGVRKRRREQNFVWFERTARQAAEKQDVWIEIGNTRYRSAHDGMATWASGRGPDGLERVVDEALRMHCLPWADGRFVRSSREFWLEWDWKVPAWRETSHSTYWATSFEGDLPSIMETVWNLPLQ